MKRSTGKFVPPRRLDPAQQPSAGPAQSTAGASKLVQPHAALPAQQVKAADISDDVTKLASSENAACTEAKLSKDAVQTPHVAARLPFKPVQSAATSNKGAVVRKLTTAPAAAQNAPAAAAVINSNQPAADADQQQYFTALYIKKEVYMKVSTGCCG